MTFTAVLKMTDDTAKLTFSGELDASTAPLAMEKVEEALAQGVSSIVMLLQDLEYMASAGLRVLIVAKNRLKSEGTLYLVGTQDVVLDTIQKVGFHHSVTLLDEHEATQLKLI